MSAVLQTSPLTVRVGEERSSLLHDGRPKMLEGWARFKERKQLFANLFDDGALPVLSERLLRFELTVDEHLSVEIWKAEPFVSNAAKRR